MDTFAFLRMTSAMRRLHTARRLFQCFMLNPDAQLPINSQSTFKQFPNDRMTGFDYVTRSTANEIRGRDYSARHPRAVLRQKLRARFRSVFISSAPLWRALESAARQSGPATTAPTGRPVHAVQTPPQMSGMLRGVSVPRGRGRGERSCRGRRGSPGCAARPTGGTWGCRSRRDVPESAAGD